MLPHEVKEGQVVEIVEGEFEGYVGRVVSTKESSFGHVWADVEMPGKSGTDVVVKRSSDIELWEHA